MAKFAIIKTFTLYMNFHKPTVEENMYVANWKFPITPEDKFQYQ